MLPSALLPATLSYRPDLHVLFLRWTRPATSEEHRSGYRTALALAQAHGAGHWLVDLRSRGLASAEDFGWVLREFREQLSRELPAASRRLAYLVAPYHFELISERSRALEATLPETARPGAHVRIFMEEHLALEWLQLG
ncbi:hypothetical protein LJY25_04295 [Hymenobacter sp. BT175]|uniref:hypothetical protein n=1 Tax=Hymenobacter translucens TaxID=2886507 RepID=UPI001D0F10B8|nr:hypothetical protein [Hymenobacter translucens]MCC2545654.1 hypothetical protein [Hymenobacter translucens]